MDFIERFLGGVLDNFRKYGNDLTNPKRWEDFYQLAPILKHKKFKEEDEWRLISKPRGIDGVQFRTGKSMLIPYVKINLDESLNMVGGDNNTEIFCCIPEIYFGPTPHPNLSRTSLEMMLRKEWVFRDTGF